jgi:hypothetical protein
VGAFRELFRVAGVVPSAMTTSSVFGFPEPNIFTLIRFNMFSSQPVFMADWIIIREGSSR